MKEKDILFILRFRGSKNMFELIHFLIFEINNVISNINIYITISDYHIRVKLSGKKSAKNIFSSNILHRKTLHR